MDSMVQSRKCGTNFSGQCSETGGGGDLGGNRTRDNLIKSQVQPRLFGSIYQLFTISRLYHFLLDEGSGRPAEILDQIVFNGTDI